MKLHTEHLEDRYEMKRDFGRRLRAIRQRTGLTQDQVADRCGMTTAVRGSGGKRICAYEYGIVCPGAPIVKLLAEALGCTADELLGVEPQSW